jgi:hypothetical protein
MLASFPLFSQAGMVFVAFLSALLLVPAVLVLAILARIRRDKKPPEDS